MLKIKQKGIKKGNATLIERSGRGRTRCGCFYGLCIYSNCYFLLVSSVGQGLSSSAFKT